MLTASNTSKTAKIIKGAKQANLAYRRQYLVTYLLYSYLYAAGE